MEQHNDNSDKTTFKVEFLGEYHDVVIDWNDDKYIYKWNQLFDQLESITGVPRKFNTKILIHHYQAEDRNPHFYYYIHSFDSNSFFRKEEICDSIRDAGGRFHLAFGADYAVTQTLISYALVAESSVPEGECSWFFCQYKNTKSFFNKLKDIINNEKLNAKIASAMQSSNKHKEILRQFDVQKYFRAMCDDLYTRRYMHVDEEYRRIFCEKNLYLRTRG